MPAPVDVRASSGRQGRRPPHGVVNERTYTLQELVAAIELERRPGGYLSPGGCTITAMYFERADVAAALAEPIANTIVLTSPKRRVGVQISTADRRCRSALLRDLARLDAQSAPYVA